jgi:hypothetical protein
MLKHIIKSLILILLVTSQLFAQETSAQKKISLPALIEKGVKSKKLVKTEGNNVTIVVGITPEVIKFTITLDHDKPVITWKRQLAVPDSTFQKFYDNNGNMKFDKGDEYEAGPMKLPWEKVQHLSTQYTDWQNEFYNFIMQ